LKLDLLNRPFIHPENPRSLDRWILDSNHPLSPQWNRCRIQGRLQWYQFQGSMLTLVIWLLLREKWQCFVCFSRIIQYLFSKHGYFKRASRRANKDLSFALLPMALLQLLVEKFKILSFSKNHHLNFSLAITGRFWPKIHDFAWSPFLRYLAQKSSNWHKTKTNRQFYIRTHMFWGLEIQNMHSLHNVTQKIKF
jgi:hypothetical protein